MKSKTLHELKARAYRASFEDDLTFQAEIRALAVLFYSGVTWEQLTPRERQIFAKYTEETGYSW